MSLSTVTETQDEIPQNSENLQKSTETAESGKRRSRAEMSEEENAMKMRVVLRKQKLAGQIGKQESKSEQIQKEAIETSLEIETEKLAEIMTQKWMVESGGPWENNSAIIIPEFRDNFSGNDSEIISAAEEAMDNVTLDDESLELDALRRRRSDRKRQLAEKEKIQEQERQKAALIEEAAAEAAASALRERIAERKRHLAEKERTASPSRPQTREKTQKQYWTLAQLRQKPVPKGLDVSCLESYLTDEEFFSVFFVEKIKFYSFSEVRQLEMKNGVGLI